MREASDWMLDLRVEIVRQSGCCALEMYEKAGALGETWTAWNNACKALTGQRSEYGIRGIETTKAVSPDCLVLVHVTVIAAPQDVKVMSLRDKVVKEENVSPDGGHKLAVRKRVKKPTSKAASIERDGQGSVKSRCEWNFKSISGVIGNLRKGIWRFNFSKPLSVSLTLMSSKAAESNELRSWSLRSAEM